MAIETSKIYLIYFHEDSSVLYATFDLSEGKRWIENATQKHINYLEEWKIPKDNSPWEFEWKHDPASSHYSTYHLYFFWKEIKEGKYLYIWKQGKMCQYTIREMSIGIPSE